MNLCNQKKVIVEPGTMGIGVTREVPLSGKQTIKKYISGTIYVVLRKQYSR